MIRIIALYGAGLAAAAFALQWLEVRYLTRVYAGEIYIVLLGLGCAGLGLWVGHRLTAPARPSDVFEPNRAAIRSLGLTPRECEVLEHLAAGRSNKEMARLLGVSPNTIKTHLARLYAKLAVQRRTQAIGKARALALIP